MLHEKFDELKLTGNLPSPSGVGLRILQLTQSDSYALDDVVQVLQIDPALSGRIIKLANSARYAGRQPVSTVAQASMRLGVQRVRALSLGFTLVDGNRTGACEGFDYRRYWIWSLACAVTAQAIARHITGVDPIEAFTAGLMNRIGRLALATVHPDAYSKLLLEHRDAHFDSLLEHESRLFDINHLEVSAAMMADWGLPEDVVNAVLRLQSMHGPQDDSVEEELALAPVVRAANLIADACADGLDLTREEAGDSSLDCVGRDLGIDREGMIGICHEVNQEWPRWAEMLEVPSHVIRDITYDRPRANAMIPQHPASSHTSTTPRGEGDTASSQPTVLVADDDSKQLRLIKHHLGKAGYRVVAARDGQEALQMAVRDHPQIVVTDWMMPELNGLELCKALRRTQAGRSMYVLILTAREDEDRIIEAFNAGADDYVSKPFNPRILLARVRAGRRLIELQQQVDDDKHHRMRQVAEMGRLTRKLRAAALTDVLTELPNRRFAMKRLEEEWTRAKLNQRPLSVIMVDIDHFKRVNDEFGHDIGDTVLRETARVLRAKTRRGDFVCRLGGEEFLVINVNSTIDTAAICAERLRTAVEANVIECGDFEKSVTVSLGLADVTDSMRGIDDLIKSADEAVYQAKDDGRNRVTRSDGGEQRRTA